MRLVLLALLAVATLNIHDAEAVASGPSTVGVLAALTQSASTPAREAVFERVEDARAALTSRNYASARWSATRALQAMDRAPSEFTLEERAELDILLARIYAFGGRLSGFLRHAESAVRGLEAAGATDGFAYGQAMYYQGLADAHRRDYASAAYHSHVASVLFDAAGEEHFSRALQAHLNGQRYLENLAAPVVREVQARINASPYQYASGYFSSDETETPPLSPGFTDAEPIERTPPRYPDGAARIGRSGIVVVQFDVDETGRVVNASVMGAAPGNSGFGEAALEAVQAWQYQPATQDGVPVPRPGVRTTLEFRMGR